MGFEFGTVLVFAVVAVGFALGGIAALARSWVRSAQRREGVHLRVR